MGTEQIENRVDRPRSCRTGQSVFIFLFCPDEEYDNRGDTGRYDFLFRVIVPSG